jgi:curved DNA-binding protein CbpA
MSSFNAYHILGLTTDANEAEIGRRRKELLRLTALGSTPTYPIDSLVSEKPERTKQTIDEAYQRLEDSQKRIKEKLYWVSEAVINVIGPSSTSTPDPTTAVFRKLSIQSDAHEHDLFVLGTLILQNGELKNRDLFIYCNSASSMLGEFGSDYFDLLYDESQAERGITEEYIENLREAAHEKVQVQFQAEVVKCIKQNKVGSAKSFLEIIGQSTFGATFNEELIDKISDRIRSELNQGLQVVAEQIRSVDSKTSRIEILVIAEEAQQNLEVLKPLLLQDIAPCGLALLRSSTIQFNNLAFVFAHALNDSQRAIQQMDNAALFWSSLEAEDKLIQQQNRQGFVERQNATQRPPTPQRPPEALKPPLAQKRPESQRPPEQETPPPRKSHLPPPSVPKSARLEQSKLRSRIFWAVIGITMIVLLVTIPKHNEPSTTSPSSTNSYSTQNSMNAPEIAPPPAPSDNRHSSELTATLPSAERDKLGTQIERDKTHFREELNTLASLDALITIDSLPVALDGDSSAISEYNAHVKQHNELIRKLIRLRSIRDSLGTHINSSVESYNNMK